MRGPERPDRDMANAADDQGTTWVASYRAVLNESGTRLQGTWRTFTGWCPQTQKATCKHRG